MAKEQPMVWVSDLTSLKTLGLIIDILKHDTCTYHKKDR